MARITLVPQRKEFFVLYNRAAANAVAISRLLVDLLGRKPKDDLLLRHPSSGNVYLWLMK